MAIQLPNPGLGDGQTGDNEYVMWTKVKNNFNNNSHAASRLIGTERSQVASYGYNGIDGTGIGGTSTKPMNWQDKTLPTGVYKNTQGAGPFGGVDGMDAQYGTVFRMNYEANNFIDLYINRNPENRGVLKFRQHSEGIWGEIHTVYHTGNTTLDSGYLISSSPVLRLKHDNFEKVHESEYLDIKVDNPEMGVYKITGTTGLRSDGGWYFRPPKDEHMNVLCMVEVEEKDEVITVKTYAKKFDFDTVSIVPDYEQPINIPDNAVALLRFNDLPLEDE